MSPLSMPRNPWACPGGRIACRASAPRADWLEARRSLVGSSDVAKLFGASGYGDAYTVWADKTSPELDSPPSIAQQRGTDLEDAVIAHWLNAYADFPVAVRRAGLMRSRSHPHAGATVDRLSVCAFDGTPHRCLIEVKTQNNTAEWADDQVPAAFQLQGLWQLAVTGREHVHYVGMGPRFALMHRIVLRDDEAIAVMLDRVEQFWTEHVAAGVAPPPKAADSDAVRRLNFTTTPGEGATLEVPAELADTVHELLAADAALAEAKERRDTAQVVLQQAMGTATELVWPDGETAATWRAGATIDGVNAAFRRAYPELVERYSTPVPEHTELDVAKLIENESWLLERGVLRRRRTFNVKR